MQVTEFPVVVVRYRTTYIREVEVQFENGSVAKQCFDVEDPGVAYPVRFDEDEWWVYHPEDEVDPDIEHWVEEETDREIMSLVPNTELRA